MSGAFLLFGLQRTRDLQQADVAALCRRGQFWWDPPSLG